MEHEVKQEAEMSGQIYFFDLHDNEQVVRVGYDGSTRVKQHLSLGQRLLALMPGSKDYEGRLHSHFASAGGLADIPGQRSCYVGNEIWDYVAWLVERGYAATSDVDAPHLPKLPWEVISPERASQYTHDGQALLFSSGRAARIKRAATTAFNTSLCDEWYTPASIIESARAVLGGIDLDPASCPAANAVVRADAYFSERVDGLVHEWRGRVWMNPPYGDKAPLFARKLIDHHARGDVPEAVALFNSNSMSSKWFGEVYAAAPAVLVTTGRLRFRAGTDSQAVSTPSTGSVIVYLGTNSVRFADEFSQHGTVLWTRRLAS